MKARSVVFVHQQYPDTIFGLPVRLTILVITVAFLVMVVMFLLGVLVSQVFTAIALIAFAAILIIGFWMAWRIGRTDRHVESVYMTSASFWRGSPRRWLLAGAAPVSPRGGRT